MKNVLKRGFTLVELLVVVLIIGILSSVALPQYQKAVKKSQIAGYWPMLKNLADAASVCNLEKGSFCSLNELDIEVPVCRPISGFNSCSYDVNQALDSSCSAYGASVSFDGHLGISVTAEGRWCSDDRSSGKTCSDYGLTGSAWGYITRTGNTVGPNGNHYFLDGSVSR